MRWLLIVAVVLHAALGASVGLSVDEAHYALYATHMALSYFDHPPLVGWVQWPLVALNAPVALMRVLPEMLWLGTLFLVYRTTAHIADMAHGSLPGSGRSASADHRGAAITPLFRSNRCSAAGWAAVALALSPLLHVLGIGLLPDTLLMFFTALLLAQTLALMHPDALNRPLSWLGLGLVLGLAGLSKYTAIFVALAVVPALLLSHGWRLLRSPWPWLAVVLALVLISPVLMWNAQNGWISFVYQTQHGAGSVWKWEHVLRFALVQLVAYGPLMGWGMAGAALVLRSVRAAERSGLQRAHLLWLLGFFGLPMGVLAAMSGGGSSLPHWTAPAWVALAPFVGLGLAAALRRNADGRLGVQAWIVRACIALQLVLSVGLMGLMATGGAGVVSGINPFADLHGWNVAGDRAKAWARQQGLDRVAVQNWTLASRLGWYARPLPVHVLEDRFDQFDFWAGDIAEGGDALLLDWSQMAYELPLAPHGFERCTLLETLPVVRMGATLSVFRLYDCRHWVGVPQPRLKEGP